MSSDRPEKRQDLVLKQIDDDVLVYDLLTHRTTLLNWSAAAVLHLCDGEHTVAQIIAELASSVDAPADEIGSEIEDVLRHLAAKGMFVAAGASRRSVVRDGLSRPSAPGLGPMQVPQLGDAGVGPPDRITAVQVFGPYNSGTCLMFNYPHHLTELRTRHHLLAWKHSLPPVFKWDQACAWKQKEGGPPEALLRATLVVCMVRSPYFWLLSTAAQSYGIRFENEVATFSERLRCPVRLQGRRYENLTAIWNAYYGSYRTYLEPAGAAFVRLEDLVEAPMAIVSALGRHVQISSSGVEEEVARIAATPAKRHNGPCVAGEEARQLYRVDNVANLISAADLALINQQIDHSLLAAFGYPVVAPLQAGEVK